MYFPGARKFCEEPCWKAAHMLYPQEQVVLVNFALPDALQVDAIFCLYFDRQLDNYLIPYLGVRP